jgi:hypothetical protein
MTRSPYIVGPRYDWIFFLSPPLAALALGIAISGSRFADGPILLAGNETTTAGVAIGVLIHAHLVAVVFRSHANEGIFKLYPLRFTLVPVALYFALVFVEWLAVLSLIVATFWDVWHSGAQTFGFARIYDRNRGAPPELGRRLDFWLSQLGYAGPILAGATLMDHVVVFEEMQLFDDPISSFLTLVPARAEGNARTLTWIVVGIGGAFLAYYLFAYTRYWVRGYRPSPHKIFLLVSTAACSIVTWGWNSWGEAFFIMNAFHAVQYLALVWATEGERLAKRLSFRRFSVGKPLVLALFLTSVFAYGAAVELVDPSIETFWAVTMVVSLMHFWYDAFVWSVQKRQI